MRQERVALPSRRFLNWIPTALSVAPAYPIFRIRAHSRLDTPHSERKIAGYEAFGRPPAHR
jgi:hypothetical protein